jgi:hypothetical protein
MMPLPKQKNIILKQTVAITAQQNVTLAKFQE